MLIRDQDSGVERVKCVSIYKEEAKRQRTIEHRHFGDFPELTSCARIMYNQPFRPILHWLEYVYGVQTPLNRLLDFRFQSTDIEPAYLYKDGVTILYSVPLRNRADVSCTDRYFIWTTFGREVVPTIEFPHGVLVCLQYCVRFLVS